MPSVQSTTEELLTALGLANKQIATKYAPVIEDVHKQQEADRLKAAAAEEAAGFTGADGTRRSLEAILQEKRESQVAQDNTITAAVAAGADPRANATATTERMAKLGKDVDRSINDTSLVRDKLETRFLDHPLNWIANQFTLGGDIERANASRQAVATEAAGILSLNQAVQAEAVKNNQIKKTITDGTIAADMKANAAFLTGKAAEKDFALLGQGTATIMAGATMTAHQIDNLAKAQSATINSGQFALAQKQAARMEENMRSEIAARNLDMEIKQGNLDAAKEVAATIVIGAKSGDNVILDPKMFSTQKLAMMYANGHVDAKRWFEQGIKFQAYDHPVLGSTPADVAGAVMELKGKGQPAAAPILELYKKSVKDISLMPATELMASGINPAKKEDIHRGAGIKVALVAGEMAKNIEFTSDGYNGNIYAPPSLDVVTADNGKWFAATTNTALWQKVLGPQIKVGGLSENNPKVLVARGLEGVKAGLITPAEFDSGIATYARQMQWYNNGTRFYQGYGLPPQAGFPTTIDSGVMGGGEIYDLAKDTDVTRMRLKFDITSGIRAGILNGLTGGFGGMQ